MKGNSFIHFSYINPPPVKNNECNLRDVREIQIILQQYCAILKENSFIHFSYINPPPVKNNECNLRDVREIQIILQQYCAVTTKLAIFQHKCMEKVKTHTACK